MFKPMPPVNNKKKTVALQCCFIGQQILIPFFFPTVTKQKSICFQNTNSTLYVCKTYLVEISQNSFFNIQEKQYSGGKALKISSVATAPVNLIPYSNIQVQTFIHLPASVTKNWWLWSCRQVEALCTALGSSGSL